MCTGIGLRKRFFQLGRAGLVLLELAAQCGGFVCELFLFLLRVLAEFGQFFLADFERFLLFGLGAVELFDPACQFLFPGLDLLFLLGVDFFQLIDNALRQFVFIQLIVFIQPLLDIV